MSDKTEPKSILDQFGAAFRQGMAESQERHDRKREAKRQAKLRLLAQQEAMLRTMLGQLDGDNDPASPYRADVADEMEVWLELYREVRR